MKILKTTSLILLLTTIVSCIIDKRKNIDINTVQREELFGKWKLTEIPENVKADDIIMKDFILNPDSTVVAHSEKEKATGEWKLKNKMNLGNDVLGVELKQDIMINANFKNHILYLGFSMVEKEGKRYLSCGVDKLYEKIK